MSRTAQAFDKLFEKQMDIQSQYENALEMLGLNPEDSLGGTIRFNMTVDEFDKFKEIAPDFVNLDDCQNDSPTLGELVDFSRANDFILTCYIVEPSRSDYRLTVDGIAKENSEEAYNALMGFINGLDKTHCPDERPGDKYDPEESYVVAWWD